VYSSRPGEWKPDLGDYLGDLTDEVPDNRIIEFVTDGPKNYAYKIARPNKDGNTTICKVRGITQLQELLVHQLHMAYDIRTRFHKV
jgi:hypothetical protein